MAKFKYRLKEQAEKNVEEFQTKRIESFDDLEKRIEALVPKLRKAKIATIKYYRENPNSFSIVYSSDLIEDYIDDLEKLLDRKKD